MASISQLSEEERNFIRFHLLTFKGSLEIVRRFFDGVFPPAHLAQTINRNFAAIINLNKLKRINAVQLDLLRRVPGTAWPSYLPLIPVGTNATSSKDFDLTLMTCLLRNLGGLITPSNGWDQLPHQNDTLPGADLATLKWYRNQIAHATVTSMENNEFTDKWTRVEKALTSLNKGQIPHAVIEILNYDLDGEKAKTLAIAELEQLTKDYLECEKEKEQIESDFSYYKDGNLPKNIADANENFVKTWITDDEIFYETKGTKLVYNEVKDFNCILVTSNSGIGKTATIRHIALKLKFEGFEIVPVESLDDIIKYKTKKKQVFLIDDVLGKNDLSPTLLEEWERKNEKLISFLETEIGSTKILCTLRLQITLSKRFRNASTVLNKVVINLEHGSNGLSEKEKRSILMKHLRRKNLEISREEIDIMCKNKYAFPLLCKLVSNSKERFRKRIAFFRQPLSLLSEELDQISYENKKLYCILVICMLFNGSFSSNIFDIYSNEFDEKINRIMQTCGLRRHMFKKELEDSACSVVGSYFTKDSDNFRFIHDALEETVGCHFYMFNPKVMLSECDISFIIDRIRVRSKENSPEIVDQNIVIIKEDEFNETHLEPLYNRLCDELSNGRFSSLLMSDLFKNRNFVRLFGTTFDNKHCTLKSKHTLLIKNSSEVRQSSQSFYNRYLHILLNDEFKDKRDAISRVKWSIYGRRTLMYWIVAFGRHELFQYTWNKMTKLERKWILSRDFINQHLVKSFFPLAVLGGSFDIVKELILSGADVNCFSEFGETPLYIAVKSGRCKVVRLLMENGAQVNLRRWFTMKIPILVASNKPELTSLILEYDLNQTELHKAVRSDDLESLRSKLRSEDVDYKTKSGWTVLHYAVLLNNLKAVQVLFHEELTQNDDSYFDFEQAHKLKVSHFPKSIADNNGLTAVHLAVINNNVDILSVLLRNKAEVKIRDDFDRTPLHYTTSGKTTKVLLSQSSQKRCLLEYTRLLEDGRAYNKTPMSVLRTTCFNFTLHTALRNVCRDFVNMPDKEGNTPLHSVIKRNILKEESHSCIETLFENGANPFLVNNDGISAYGLNQSSFDTVRYISHKQSIEKYHNVFALFMLFVMGLTLGVAIYMCVYLLIIKDSQNECFIVGQVSESDNIKLLQLSRGIYVILITILFFLALSLMRFSVFFWRVSLIFELIIYCSFIVLSIFVYIPFEYDLMYKTILVLFICKWITHFAILDYFKTFVMVSLYVISLCMISFVVRVCFQYGSNFYTKHDLNTLRITALNCTELTSCFANISCTSLTNTITYRKDSDFSVKCRTDPNITNDDGRLAVESRFIDLSERCLISLFCLNFWLNAACSFCFVHCMLIILIYRYGKIPFLYKRTYAYRFIFNFAIFGYWYLIMFVFYLILSHMI